jgi:hypothetical protein
MQIGASSYVVQNPVANFSTHLEDEGLGSEERMIAFHHPQNPAPTKSSNPNCLQNAVEGSPGVGRPFATNPRDPSISSHNGAHALSPDHRARVSTLEPLQGRVIWTNRQDSTLFLADVRLPNGNVAAYLDLQSVSVRRGQPVGTGDAIGTVRAAGDPRNGVGLHLSLVLGQYYNQYRQMRQQGAIGFPTKFFIDPLGPNSPVNCPP